MIKPGEIQNKAREFVVRDQQIEKDYILSWVLQGIAQHEELSKAIVFKGGTVLKKSISKITDFLKILILHYLMTVQRTNEYLSGLKKSLNT